MSQWNPSAKKTFVTSAAVSKYRRVVIAADGTVSHALVGASGDWHGIALDNAGSGEEVTVLMKNAAGTFRGVAAGAITALAPVYGAATGKIDDASSGTAIGTALEAATADGDIIEWLPN
jgi:hypothetical protein